MKVTISGKIFVCLLFLVCNNGHKISSKLHGMLAKFLENKNLTWKLKEYRIHAVKPANLKLEILSTYEMKGMVNRQHCSEILKANSKRKGKDGVYVIYPDLHNRKEVFCDMTTEGGGWTVIQKRKDGSTDFYRSWKQYKRGFGDPSKNYWIGNDVIHLLTNGATQQLRIDLQRFTGERGYAKYSRFSIGSEDTKYRLTVSGYSGTIKDALKYHNYMMFTTKDKDNDKVGGNHNCAHQWHGAWWYNHCHHSNLNGLYTGSAVVSAKHPTWSSLKGKHEALKATQMMIRPANI